MSSRSGSALAAAISVSFTVLGVAGTLDACSSSSGPGSGGGSGSGSGSSGSGGGGSSGSEVCSMVPSISTPYVGSVAFVGSYSPANFYVTADFGPLVSGDAGVAQGGCTSTCAADEPFGDSLGAAASTNAGTLTVTDGTTTLTTIPLASGAAYQTPMGTSLMWAPGDLLGVSASGDTVQAFTGSVHAVHAFAGVQPPLASSMNVSLGSDLTFTWQPDPIGGASVRLRLNVMMNGRLTGEIVSCWADDSKGTITVPKSLLASTFGSGGTALLGLERRLRSLAQGPNVTVQLLSFTGTVISQVTFQ